MTVKVISASRRVDMIAGYPDLLIELLAAKCPPEKVHTVVLWTKNPTNLLAHESLRAALRGYGQLFLHYSITGMGASALEPAIPPTDEALRMLPELIAFVGAAERVRVRFDPIVHLKFPNNERYTNIHEFKNIAGAAAEVGVRNISISWMQVYKKVSARLRRFGIEPLAIKKGRWNEEVSHLRQIAARHGLRLHFCCVPELPQSRCIDGEVLNRLHPGGQVCSEEPAKGQRELCGCTESWDIGWYSKCVGGCLYCYANPQVGGT